MASQNKKDQLDTKKKKTKSQSTSSSSGEQQQQRPREGGGGGGGATSDNNEGDATRRSKQRQLRSWGLTQTLMLVIAVCAFVSSWISMTHVHGGHVVRHHANSAIHQAMKDFMQKLPRNGGKLVKRNNRPLGADEEPEEEDDDSEGGDNQAKRREERRDTTAAAGASSTSTLSTLSCKAYGGPDDEHAQEMVYWQDIQSDRRYVSPFHAKRGAKHKRYLSFEPDGGGWNNIRMAMETVLGLAIAMGRTLVLPPEQRMYLIGNNKQNQKHKFGFQDFFPVHELASENDGLEIITMKEFLETEAIRGGNFRDKETGMVTFPPGNRTDWDGGSGDEIKSLKEWLRNSTHTPLWGPEKCMAAFPATSDPKDIDTLRSIQKQIVKDGLPREDFVDPIPVDSGVMERMRENMGSKRDLCLYDEEMQKEPVLHFMCYHKMRVRMLVHFYAFLFFEDWREDLWMKRFMRDHVRYTDEIQCAAAKIVHAMRNYAKRKGDPRGEFDTFHVRRGDFQFKRTRISAEEMYRNTKDILKPGAIVYVATDERDKKFFDPMKKHYDIKFLDDFIKTELSGVNTNYYGMIDQLVASRGRNFVGCWHSTFTGFINRIRGYHSVKDKSPGYEKGLLPTSYYYIPLENKKIMNRYARLKPAYFNREFPTSWRDIDKGIGNLPNMLKQE